MKNGVEESQPVSRSRSGLYPPKLGVASLPTYMPMVGIDGRIQVERAPMNYTQGVSSAHASPYASAPPDAMRKPSAPPKY
ncbi:predicted protein [Chaetomium globosum CBS 148.51]|uniref:Uncharacterized protein n=1 Tax=Chaetomium globosum (strain ATCC 6205 / CBS 148.51 / DSM 1962 / NBRC 6347 / NRRL 1970) TaxID=306901 RepID=Q2GWD6_CHAGB|nr:uncharacterized protein CHGG_07718 [Chaetomium globosum CBS 148.51]EAQ86465.1 predicted protein [Chaetomium globosum CBS 148.51]